MNLPIKITFGTTGSIEYLYNATGQKVSKMVNNGSIGIVTDYLDGYQYLKIELTFFPHAEGYVKHTKDSNNNSRYDYVFNYTDHLGNVRLSYSKDPITELLTVLEENNYYPYGLKHKNYNIAKKQYEMSNPNPELVPCNNCDYKYRYNGQEWQDEFGLNMYAMDMRQFDPAIARWVIQDPVIHHFQSPYNGFDGNPVFWADPSGADVVETKDAYVFDGDDAKSAFSALMDGTSYATTGNYNYVDVEMIQDHNGNGGGTESGENGDPPNKAQIAYLKNFHERLKHIFSNNFEFGDAVWHWRLGNGESVDINLSSLDFGSLSVKDFHHPDFYHEGAPGKYIRFDSSDFATTKQALIYGTIEVVYIGNGSIMALPNKYDFDMKFDMSTAKGIIRDVATLLAVQFNGGGNAYWINFMGTTKIKRK